MPVHAPPLVHRVHRIDRAATSTHSSNHPLGSPSVRSPSPAPLAGTFSDSIVLGASPRPTSRSHVDDVPATSSPHRTTSVHPPPHAVWERSLHRLDASRARARVRVALGTHPRRGDDTTVGRALRVPSPPRVTTGGLMRDWCDLNRIESNVARRRARRDGTVRRRRR